MLKRMLCAVVGAAIVVCTATAFVWMDSGQTTKVVLKDEATNTKPPKSTTNRSHVSTTPNEGDRQTADQTRVSGAAMVNPLGNLNANSDVFNPMRGSGAREPIMEIPLKSVAEADLTLDPDDLVLGVVIKGQARAYPITQLCGPQREIINDHLGGVPIAATW